MRPSESPDERPGGGRRKRDPLTRKVGAYLRYSHLGLQFLIAIGLPIAGGVWLDAKLGTKAVFTILGLMLGFGVGTYSLYVEIYRRGGRGRDDADRGTEEAGERDGERDRKRRG